MNEQVIPIQYRPIPGDPGYTREQFNEANKLFSRGDFRFELVIKHSPESALALALQLIQTARVGQLTAKQRENTEDAMWHLEKALGQHS
jgi:hypothetical protein